MPEACSMSRAWSRGGTLSSIKDMTFFPMASDHHFCLQWAVSALATPLIWPIQAATGSKLKPRMA